MTTTTDHQPVDEEVITSFEERVRALPLRLAFEHEADNEHKLNSILATWPYLMGEMPVHHNVHVERVAPDRAVALAGGTVVRTSHSRDGESQVVVGAGWVAMVSRRAGGDVWLSLSAITEAVAAPIVADVRAWTEPPPVEPAHIAVTFLHYGGCGAVHSRRRFTVEEWSEIRRNYVAGVQERVDRLVALTPETLSPGRLLLLHGPPGTGKTTLLRALTLAWRSWCDAYVVLDPEVLFASASYLFEAVLGDGDEEFGGANVRGDRWRLFIVEDCDELIRAEAKERTGQALSRLLNLADGLVGQGTRVLVCLTTNEAVGRLHPAVRRPGRCLAEIEVPRFDRSAGRAWLGGATPLASDGASLAELYAMANGHDDAAEPESPVAVGQYL